MLADLGEFGAIRLFQELLAMNSPAGLAPEIGIGDDAAVWRPTPGRLVLETTDLLIEEVHFSLRHMSWYDVGWKAMAVNVSDVAAMGGEPKAAFVSAGLSPSMSSSDAAELYRGLAACASSFGVAVLGGDTVSAPLAAVLNVALFGEADSVLRRSLAAAGDAVAVSGPLGVSAAYLLTFDDAYREAHVHPVPRVDLGQKLVGAGIRCAMDISDGLVADLAKICEASGVGAVVQASAVPVSSGVALLAALTGGEDYELLACGPAPVLAGLGMTMVGSVVSGSGVRVIDASGTELALEQPGYDALKA